MMEKKWRVLTSKSRVERFEWCIVLVGFAFSRLLCFLLPHMTARSTTVALIALRRTL